MNDMRAVIVPKSDQINADTLLGNPMTITISSVSIRPGTEQPVSIHFDGDAGKPYKPCNSMARVMVNLWGPDANEYVGRSMTLYCDEKVLWGGMAVGGIRISHMSNIGAPMTMALTATKGNKKPFTVKPLVAEKPLAKKGVRELLAEKIAEARSLDDLMNATLIPAVAKILADGPEAQKLVLNKMLSEAYARFSDDAMPTDETAEEAA